MRLADALYSVKQDMTELSRHMYQWEVVVSQSYSTVLYPGTRASTLQRHVLALCAASKLCELSKLLELFNDSSCCCVVCAAARVGENVGAEGGHTPQLQA